MIAAKSVPASLITLQRDTGLALYVCNSMYRTREGEVLVSTPHNYTLLLLYLSIIGELKCYHPRPPSEKKCFTQNQLLTLYLI